MYIMLNRRTKKHHHEFCSSIQVQMTKYPWLLILYTIQIFHHEKKGPQMCGANFRQYRYKP